MPPLRAPSLGTTKFPTSTSLTNFKQESYKILNRISCHLFPHTNHNSNQSGANILERRTIQSTQISTISSLVDKTKLDYDAQKENYGLYALKCNRNALKNGLIISIPPVSSSSSPASAEPYNSNDINHEQFLPCNQSTGSVSFRNANSNNNNRGKNFSSLNTSHGGELYKIKFTDTMVAEYNGSHLAAETNSTQNANDTNGVKNNERNFSQTKEGIKKVPPPRKKKFLPTSHSEEILKVPKTTSKAKAPNAPTTHIPLMIPHRGAHHQLIEQQNNISLVASNNSSKLLMQKINSADDILISMGNLQKNPSELYRIAEMSIHQPKDTSAYGLFTADPPDASFATRRIVSPPFNSITKKNIIVPPATKTTLISKPPVASSNKNLTTASHPVVSFAKKLITYPPNVSFSNRNKTSVKDKRKTLQKQFSTTESINIFSSHSDSDVFTDFNEALFSVPVVPVQQDSIHRNKQLIARPIECDVQLCNEQVNSSINLSSLPKDTISDRINLKSSHMKNRTTTLQEMSTHKQDAQPIYNKVNNEDDIVDNVVITAKESTNAITSSVVLTPQVAVAAEAYSKVASTKTIMLSMNNERKLINNFQNSANINTNFQTKLHYTNTTQQKPKQTDKTDMCVIPHTSAKTTTHMSNNSSSNIINSSNDCSIATIPHTQIITTDNNICYNITRTTNKVGIRSSGTAASSGNNGGVVDYSGGITRRVGNNNNNYEVCCNKNDKMTTTSTRSVYVMNLVTV